MTKIQFEKSEKITKDAISAQLLESLLSADLQNSLIEKIDENSLLGAAIALMRERIEELEQLAETDTLTPLPNRRRFLREMERLIERRRRYGMPSCVMFIDVNGLKAINDSYGHLAGDAALIHIANTLSVKLRKSDLLARLGGDEFGLLLEQADKRVGEIKAKQLCKAVEDHPLEIQGQIISLSVSIGISEIESLDRPEHALDRADTNMYAIRAQARSER